jgi:hypothetical protein
MDVSKARALIATKNRDGKTVFLEVPRAAVHVVPELTALSIVWSCPAVPTLPDLGFVPNDTGFPRPGFIQFGLACVAGNSAGKLDIRKTHGADQSLGMVVQDEDPAMHRSDTIDYEVILSGRIDVELEDGIMRTLGPGDCMIMGGVLHAWKNRYDEPCVFTVTIVGANR